MSEADHQSLAAPAARRRFARMMLAQVVFVTPDQSARWRRLSDKDGS